MICLFSKTQITAQSELSQFVINAYEEDGWAYFGNNSFLNREKEEEFGNPRVLSLQIDPSTSTGMLYLWEFDCSNHRLMMIAYKSHQNNKVMEKKHYLFDNVKKWQYPLKTSQGDLMLRAVCEKYGNSKLQKEKTYQTQNNNASPVRKNSESYYVNVTHPQAKITLETVEVINNKKTVLYFSAEGNPKYANGGWICIGSDHYIIDPLTAKKYRLLKTNKLPICPNKHHFQKVDQKHKFSIEFEAISTNTRSLNFVDDNDSSWNLYGIDLK